jgi:DNA-damage-inducible protein J
MAKTALIKARIEPELKEEVNSIFKALGLSASEAIQLFYSRVKALRRLPFEVKIPNEETLRAFRDSDEGKNLVKTKNLDDLFNQLGFGII